MSSKKTTIFLLRHGEREDHINPKWRETAARPFDPPLSPVGIKQAEATAQYIKSNLSIDVLITSPFFRTLQTSHSIANSLGLKQNIEYGLAEWLLTSEDNPFAATPQFDLDSLAKDFPHISPEKEKSSLVAPSEYTFPEPEREELHSKRLSSLKQRLTEKYGDSGKTILCVTHGAIVRGLPEVLANKILTETPHYCSLTKIVFENNSWSCEFVSDDSHLPEDLRQKTTM